MITLFYELVEKAGVEIDSCRVCARDNEILINGAEVACYDIIILLA